MKTFDEFLNEGKVSFDKMTFTISCFSDAKGLAIQFIPDSKTLDVSINLQVESIQSKLKKDLPFIADLLRFESGHEAAGRIFRINTIELSDKITKALK